MKTGKFSPTPVKPAPLRRSSRGCISSTATAAGGEDPSTVQALTRSNHQVHPSASLSCAFCVYLIPVIAGSLVATVLVLVYMSRGRRSPLCRRSCGQTYKPPVIVDSSDSRLSTVLSECSDDGLHLNKFSVTRLKTEVRSSHPTDFFPLRIKTKHNLVRSSAKS